MNREAELERPSRVGCSDFVRLKLVNIHISLVAVTAGAKNHKMLSIVQWHIEVEPNLRGTLLLHRNQVLTKTTRLPAKREKVPTAEERSKSRKS